MKQNLVRELSFSFSINVINLYKKLTNEHEYVLSKQLLRSATSIGANIEEAVESISKKEFVYKMSISLKEARETRYWLKLLELSKIAGINYSKYLADVDVLISILVKIVKTSKENIRFEIRERK